MRGVPIPHDLPEESTNEAACFDEDIELGQYRRELLEWALDELLTRHTFVTLVLGCGVYGSGNLSQQSQLVMLRGHIGPCERIAKFLGVKVGKEVGMLRRAAAALAAIEDEVRDREESEEATGRNSWS